LSVKETLVKTAEKQAIEEYSLDSESGGTQWGGTHVSLFWKIKGVDDNLCTCKKEHASSRSTTWVLNRTKSRSFSFIKA